MDEAGSEIEGTSKIGGLKPSCSPTRISAVDIHFFLGGTFAGIADAVEWFKGDLYDRCSVFVIFGWLAGS